MSPNARPKLVRNALMAYTLYRLFNSSIIHLSCNILEKCNTQRLISSQFATTQY